jgi:pimeloyl-ACP methyl ester carboxylesterase
MGSATLRRLIAAAVVSAMATLLAGAAHAASAGLRLDQCGSSPLVECGSIQVPPFWSKPGQGQPLTVHFRVYRHTDQSAAAGVPVVGFEGGPGYGSIGSATTYLLMLGPLHRTHDLIVMDSRGTGSSGAIKCPRLQQSIGSYVADTGECAERLGAAAGAYGTAALGDDMAAIVDGLGVHTVDVYGDSYGTYAAQSFTLHHPSLVRAVVLDGAYGQDFDPFEREASAMLRNAWTTLCARAGSCAGILQSIGGFDHGLAAHPLTGVGLDADGNRVHVRLTARKFVQLVFDATYAYTFFRDLPAALVAYRAGDRAPLLRLAAEDASLNVNGGYKGYSVGDYDAVACHDYPTIWNVSAPLPQRRRQLNAAIAKLSPGSFAPFDNATYLSSLDENQLVRGCLEWPKPAIHDPAFPRVAYPHTPVLILDGEFDQATPVPDARRAAAAWPDSTFVDVHNTGHISALDDFGGCASGIVRRFLSTLNAGDTSCASHTPVIVVVPRFPDALAGAPGTTTAQRAAWVAGQVVGDGFSRWWNLMYTTHGVGLRGGGFTVEGPYTSLKPLTLRFGSDRFVSDLAVSGTAVFVRTTDSVHATLRLAGPAAASGRLTLSFATDTPGAMATVTGRLGGAAVSLKTPAPWATQG